jgi:general secretion pathway protein D
MNKLQTLITIAGLVGQSLLAAEPGPGTPNPAPTNSVPAAEEVKPATELRAPPPPPVETGTNVTAAPVASDNGTNSTAAPVQNADGLLRLHFRGASLDMVLNYLSEAAGFIIVLETQPRGKIDIWSNQPLSKDEAVELLNSVLNKNGYACIRKGRTLTIFNKDEAKTKAIPVRNGSDPELIPDSDEMVTQIIPVRFVEVGQLIKDLQPLVSTQTAMTANESGNSIVITDTSANIRRVAEIIKAIDGGAEDVTVVRVFRLLHADPQETADLLTSLFPDDSRSSGSQTPFAFGGPGGGFRRMFGGGGPGAVAGANNSASQRIKKRNRVIAVADPRTASVVVTAAKDLMDQIEGVIAELDPDPSNQKTVAVFPLQNAEPQDAMQVLQDIFQKSGTMSNNRNQQNQNNALQNRSAQQSQQYNNTMNRQGTTRGRGTGFGQ